MSVKVRAKGFAGTMVLIVAVAGAFWLLDPNRLGRGKDHTMMALLLTFVPAQRTDPIRITVRFNGATEYTDTAKHSPWGETIPAPVGTLVTLVASQGEPQLLACSITTKGVIHGPNYAKPSNQGHTCVVMATA